MAKPSIVDTSFSDADQRPPNSPCAPAVAWPIERLIPYARNPRKNDAAVDRMAASIREFGFKIPVLTRSNVLGRFPVRSVYASRSLAGNSRQNRHVRRNEVLPVRGLASLWRRPIPESAAQQSILVFVQ